MKKSLLVTITILAGLTIAGCSDSTVASSTAGKITEDDFYEAMKETVGTSMLQQLIIEDVLTDLYGDVVTDEVVDKQYTTEETAMGGADAFENIMLQQGYTPDNYKDTIRLNLLIEEAVKDKTKLSEEEIKAAYDAYTPAVTAAHILVEDEETAKDLITQLNDGADFAELATENSADTASAANGGEVTFSSGEMVAEFEEAAFALKEGEMTTEPVATEYGYHIIKMIEKPEKGTLEEETDTIEDQLLTTKLADSAYIQEVISGIMQDANIIIEDKDLSTAMDTYLVTEEEPATEESATEEPTTEEPATEESATEESATEESAVEESAAE
ncbi:foldase protein PrsA [Carnobacterium alterfunditum]|uniref:Foldase protein PrsA n=1 Tax=Carnobacterium alterfunditum TaxID=28230 RepID=A0A1N6GAW3_9LACT|nr:peptidylprolyl isomerase [Carnobacterium alterfunditum]SIO04634.1 foldase protein PrsA [Carnobacterium alterfunditum]